MSLDPMFEGKDIELVFHHSIREIDGKRDQITPSTLVSLRSVNVIDDLYSDRKGRSLKFRRKLLKECQIFISKNKGLLKED